MAAHTLPAMRRETGLVVAVVLSLVTLVVGSALPAGATFPTTSSPTLELDHTLRTSPFVGSDVSTKDNEGSAYVPSDGSLWLADDNSRRIYEVDAASGALKRTIGSSVFENARQLGGNQVAGIYRNRDLESITYDEANDALYVFSGSCCTTSVLPTVFRLTRDGSGDLQVDSFQPLPADSDNTASGWNPDDGNVYVGRGSVIRAYDYTSNSFGPGIPISNLDGILGMTFSADGSDLYVARSQTRLSRVDWGAKSLVSGWTFDLSPFGVLDSRAVEVINDQFWVSDGYDARAAGDPLAHAVFVFNVPGSSTPPTDPAAPTASFTTSTTSGDAPLTVTFTDTSTGSPTSWAWNFGDGSTSTTRSPTHTFDEPGTYRVVLTVTNSAGTDDTKATITATQPVKVPTASFTASPTSGDAPLTVTFTDTSADEPTSWAWDFGDGSTSTTRSPTHTFDEPGTYRVVLTVTNSAGTDDTTEQISAKDGAAPEGQYAVSGGDAWATYTKVSLAEISLSDNVTALDDITRVVDWGDGTTAQWRSGATLSHVYDVAGTYLPSVLLTDQAGNSARVQTGSVVVRTDSAAPRATLTRPSTDRGSVSSWAWLRGRVSDGTGSGVASVRLRIVEKRSTAWYAYDGSSRSWVKAGSTRASAMRLSRLAVFRPATSDWTYRLRGLRRGLLVVKVSARDRVGNLSSPTLYEQTLTRL